MVRFFFPDKVVIYWIHTMFTTWVLNYMVCLGIWLWLLFKVLFMLKYIKIIFFYFLKIIFEISTSKRFKTHKKLIFSNFFLILEEHDLHRFRNRI